MKKISDFIIYSNLLISVCTAGFIWETYILLHLPVNPLYIAIGFAGTLFTYNIDRLVVLGSIGKTGNERHIWMVQFRKAMTVISAISFIFLAVAVFFLSKGSLIFLGHLGVLSLGYSVP